MDLILISVIQIRGISSLCMVKLIVAIGVKEGYGNSHSLRSSCGTAQLDSRWSH